MSAKAISEATGKDIINRNLSQDTAAVKCRFASVNETTKWADLVAANPWLQTEALVAKPDQLIKRRGKLGLIKVNTDFNGASTWIQERLGKDQKIGRATGKLKNFIIEPFVAHKQAEESYVCIYSHRYADTILFYHEGGVDVGDVDAKALKLDVPVGTSTTAQEIKEKLLVNVPAAKKEMVATFVNALYTMYVNMYFTYLEINPLVVTDKSIYILDLAAKIDATADFVCRSSWGEIEYPPPFGRDAYP
jgi:ATP citrate (pro-S)-lyase